MAQTYGALCALAEQHGVVMTEQVRALLRAVEAADSLPPRYAKPVGHVYTMQALVPGESVKYHAQLYNPLPGGTPLFAYPREVSLAHAIHYPDCWCMMAYPTLDSALDAVCEHFRCTNDDSHVDSATARVARALERKQVLVDRYMVCGIAVVERARQMRGPDLWKVEKSGENLNKHGEWEHEPLPSARDDGFLKRCRFKSAEEAVDAALRSATPAKHGGCHV
ncbi:hypothetical protein [Ralstonia solanacearum]|uniref:hypothetical protein n=1 Tax=Ralstonia solanacearum TaxID=305 RepID=UPI0011C3CDE1|nr:hypothetical protein [Ralstonia solanacearum]